MSIRSVDSIGSAKGCELKELMLSTVDNPIQNSTIFCKNYSSKQRSQQTVLQMEQPEANRLQSDGRRN